jgi:hypothetical protein
MTPLLLAPWLAVTAVAVALAFMLGGEVGYAAGDLHGIGVACGQLRHQTIKQHLPPVWLEGTICQFTPGTEP